MASFDTLLAQSGGSRIGGRLGAMVSTYRAWMDRRATKKALLRLSDHELDDIGLTRADIARLD